MQSSESRGGEEMDCHAKTYAHIIVLGVVLPHLPVGTNVLRFCLV